jgi:hypothetical protein
VVLPEFLAALTDAPLDEVFLVYEAVRQNSDHTHSAPATEARWTRSVQRLVDRTPA